MTPEAQRIAIAEACGWAKIEESGPFKSWTGSRTPGIYGYIPDYLSDLNAMHEAEKSIASDQIYKYGTWLSSVVLDIEVVSAYAIPLRQGDLQAVVRATAAQRAEAFLKAIGKWQG